MLNEADKHVFKWAATHCTHLSAAD